MISKATQDITSDDDLMSIMTWNTGSAAYQNILSEYMVFRRSYVERDADGNVMPFNPMTVSGPLANALDGLGADELRLLMVVSLYYSHELVDKASHYRLLAIAAGAAEEDDDGIPSQA